MGIRSRLLWKLFSINVFIVMLVIVSVWLLFDYRAAAYFKELMRQFNVSPTMAHEMFLQAIHRYLLLATLGSVPLAAAFSLLTTRRLLQPLQRMADVAERIAAGDFEQRVTYDADDEVGAVARSFNRMTESLRRLEEARMTRVIDLAHELRSPLTNIRGYLEAVRDHVVPATPETLESLHEETVRLGRLVEDLLQLANVDAAQVALHRRWLELDPFVRRIYQVFRARFVERSIRVSIDCPPEIRLRADPDKLAQVVRNLLQNALQYTPKGGAVQVRASKQDDGVTLRVTNTGEPIPDDELPRLFERSYRGARASRTGQGTGLGLAIVRELVEAHGGRVGADCSTSGPSFWLHLPDGSAPLP